MINKLVDKILPEAIEHRRHLHKYPELSFKEFKTSEYVIDKLEGLGFDIRTGIGGTGVVAIMDTGIPGPVIAFRAELDALPIRERTSLPFRSCHDGVMHACGHDGHMAILLGTAKLISEIRDSLKGVIKLIFQPGEETDGGAQAIMYSGVLKEPKVDAIFALHMMPDVPTGKIGIKPGYIMSTYDGFFIKVHGHEAHSSEPEKGVNAIAIASQVIMGLSMITGNSLNPFDVGTLSVCTIKGGDAINVIPGSVEMSGLLRCVEPDVKLILKNKIKTVAEDTAHAYGGYAEVEFVEGFPSVNNDPELTEKCIEPLRKALETENDVIMMERPNLATEDFSYYQEKVPGVYFMLGCKQDGRETGLLHSDVLNINEESLRYGMRAWGNIIMDFCGK